MEAQYDDIISNQPVVIDNGSGLIKAGFAGTDKPKYVLQSYVGRPKHQRVMISGTDTNIFFGKNAETHRGVLSLKYPISRGIIQEWNDMELLWSHVFQEMKASAEDHPTLLTEAPLNPRRTREKSAEVFFEVFSVPAFFVAVQAILALYASGRTTGIVLDCGDGVCHTVPVYEGFALSHAMSRSDVGGRDVTTQLSIQLRRSGHIFHTSAEMEIVKAIKEAACFVAFKPQRSEEQYESAATRVGAAGGGNIPYELPDGSYIMLGNERHRAPEILFNPSLVGVEYPGVHDLLASSISRSDLDLRRILYSHIVLSGGSTLFQGFGDRMLNEIRKLAPKETKIRITAPPDRIDSTFLGGSILSSLASFQKLWIKKSEYEEEGVAAIHRKTF